MFSFLSFVTNRLDPCSQDGERSATDFGAATQSPASILGQTPTIASRKERSPSPTGRDGRRHRRRSCSAPPEVFAASALLAADPGTPPADVLRAAVAERVRRRLQEKQASFNPEKATFHKGCIFVHSILHETRKKSEFYGKICSVRPTITEPKALSGMSPFQLLSFVSKATRVSDSTMSGTVPAVPSHAPALSLPRAGRRRSGGRREPTRRRRRPAAPRSRAAGGHSTLCDEHAPTALDTRRCTILPDQAVYRAGPGRAGPGRRHGHHARGRSARTHERRRARAPTSTLSKHSLSHAALEPQARTSAWEAGSGGGAGPAAGRGLGSEEGTRWEGGRGGRGGRGGGDSKAKPLGALVSPPPPRTHTHTHTTQLSILPGCFGVPERERIEIDR